MSFKGNKRQRGGNFKGKKRQRGGELASNKELQEFTDVFMKMKGLGTSIVKKKAKRATAAMINKAMMKKEKAMQFAMNKSKRFKKQFGGKRPQMSPQTYHIPY